MLERVDDDWNVESIWTGFYRLFVSVQSQQKLHEAKGYPSLWSLRVVSKGRGQVCETRSVVKVTLARYGHRGGNVRAK